MGNCLVTRKGGSDLKYTILLSETDGSISSGQTVYKGITTTREYKYLICFADGANYNNGNWTLTFEQGGGTQIASSSKSSLEKFALYILKDVPKSKTIRHKFVTSTTVTAVNALYVGIYED